MLQMSMGNRLIPPTDGCCQTLDTAANTPRDGSTEPEPQPTLTPARNSFEIMSRFNWDVVDITMSAAFYGN